MWRYEVKFIVDPPRRPLLDAWLVETASLRRHHPTRDVHSLYYDTPDMRGGIENLIGLPDRRKTRLRWYSAAPDAAVTLEVKERQGRLGRKRTARLDSPSGEIDPFSRLEPANADIELVEDAPLFPKLKITYRRDYLQWDAGIRVTVDRELRYANPATPSVRPVTDPSHAIVEVKFPPELKDRAHDLVAEIPFYPLRHSKYLRGLDLTGRAIYA